MSKSLKKKTQELKEELEMLQLTIYGLEYQRDHFGIEDKEMQQLIYLYRNKRDIQSNLNQIARGTP